MNKKPINVLSLFDGISCGRLALQRAGIEINKYFASEIDQSAIKVSKQNWPDNIQVGDVSVLKGSDFCDIDLLLGGSPCQSFSVAGKQEGFSGKSGLFYHWHRLFEEIKPKHFLLENVVMKKEWENEITNLVGTEPVLINSSCFSAQSRKRLYWTNLSVSELPIPNKFARDYIGEDYLTKEEIKKLDISKIDFYNFKSKISQKRIIGNFRGKDQLINCLTASNSSNPAGCGCSNFVYMLEDGSYAWRKITRHEMEMAQTLPIGYCDVISDSAAKHAIGNGWTVDVIAHILKSL